MSKTFREAFLDAVEATNKSVRGVALSAGLKEDQLKSLAQGKSKTINVDDAKKVAAVFGVTLDDFYEGKLAQSGKTTIAIAGLVGAGARVPVFDAYEKGDGPQAVCPPGIGPSGVVAVEVGRQHGASVFRRRLVVLHAADPRRRTGRGDRPALRL